MTIHVIGAAGALHTITRTGTRTCARSGCDVEFTPRRADHHCCSEKCRTARWKAERGYVDPRQAQRPREAYRNASDRVQKAKPPRVRPTLTLDEARALTNVQYRPGREPFDTALAKIRAALQREEARHG